MLRVRGGRRDSGRRRPFAVLGSRLSGRNCGFLGGGLRKSLMWGADRGELRLGKLWVEGWWRGLRSLGTIGRGRRKLLLGGRRGIRPRSFLRDAWGLMGPWMRSRRVLKVRRGELVLIPWFPFCIVSERLFCGGWTPRLTLSIHQGRKLPGRLVFLAPYYFQGAPWVASSRPRYDNSRPRCQTRLSPRMQARR